MLWISFRMPSCGRRIDTISWRTSPSPSFVLARSACRRFSSSYMSSLVTSALVRSATTLGYCHTIVLDHRVGQQAVAHRLEVRLRLGFVGAVELNVEDLALAHRG